MQLSKNQENHIFFTSIFCACSFILTRVCILRLHRKSLQDPKTKAFKKPLQIACKTFANLRWLAKNSATSIWSNECQWMYQIHWSLCIFELPLAAAWSSSSSLYKENTNKRIKGLWCASSLLFELQTFRRHWTTSSRETQCTKVPYFVHKFKLIKNLQNIEFKLLGPNW